MIEYNPRFKFINLTPEELVIYNSYDGRKVVLPPSGLVATVAVKMIQRGTFGGVMVRQKTFGMVEGLPTSMVDTGYVVSEDVREAVPYRADVYSPGEPKQDTSGVVLRLGRPQGYWGLVGNFK